jgi:S-ribosylhomocysteine lyase
MRKITSFTVDHDFITEGMYISRIDGDVTTYDLRTRIPNAGDYMDNLTMHSLEHMFATYIRNSEISEDVIYFGPMGCQTGFYLLIRNAEYQNVLKHVKIALEGIISHDGEMFGNSEIECGNCYTLSLDAAKNLSKKYLDVLNNSENTGVYNK